MPRKLNPTKANTADAAVAPPKNEKLLAQIVEEFLKSLRADDRVKESVVKALEELASKGKLKDLADVQVALRAQQDLDEHATS